MKDLRGKRGQVTIFIILGILIVAAIAIFLIYARPDFIFQDSSGLGLEFCVQDAIDQSITKLGPNAGYLNPEFTYSFGGEEISYLCYTNEFYVTCVVQKPFLKQHFEKSLTEDLKGKIQECYDSSISDLKARGYEVSPGEIKYNVSIIPDFVEVKIEAPTTVGNRRFTSVDVRTGSGIYEMVMIANSILQFESQLGDSSVDSYNLLYQDFLVTKQKQEDGTTIYIIKDKAKEYEFKFASRSIAWPAGYDL